MISKIATWERKLLDWAYEGLESLPTDKIPPPDAEPAQIERAYVHCEAITQTHSKTFFTASALLPTALCRSVRALYAFCRVSDDLVDRPRRNPTKALKLWRERALNPRPPADDLVAHAGRLGQYLRGALTATGHPLLAGLRGEGLLVALQLARPVAAEVAAELLRAGFIVNAVAPDAIRLAPPLVLTTEQVDAFAAALPAALAAADRSRPADRDVPADRPVPASATEDPA